MIRLRSIKAVHLSKPARSETDAMHLNVEPAVERIGNMQCGVGESPVWHAGEQALYWTDIPGRTLWRNFQSESV